MKLAPFEEQAIVSLLGSQFMSEILSVWSNGLEVIKRILMAMGIICICENKLITHWGK